MSKRRGRGKPINKPKLIAVLAVAILGSSVPLLQASTHSIRELRDLPGGDSFCVPFAVSADGSVIVGYGYSATGREAIRWSANGTRQGLGDIPQDPEEPPIPFDSAALAVSFDGSIIVGWGSGAGREGMLWTSSNGMVSLDAFPYGDAHLYAANAVSADGLVVVGDGSTGVSAGLYSQRAILWTASNGDVDLGDFPGGNVHSSAKAVSADGSVVVGWGSVQLGIEAFRWTKATGLVGLGDLTGGVFSSSAHAITPDGSIIAGSGNSAFGHEAFRWTAAQGMVGIGDLPGGNFRSSAIGVSADGSVIVGNGDSATRGDEPFVWTADRGMLSMLDMLDAAGVSEASNWFQLHATGVSADGRTIVGYGIYQSRFQGWIATIPEPSSVVLAACAASTTLLIVGFRRRCGGCLPEMR